MCIFKLNNQAETFSVPFYQHEWISPSMQKVNKDMTKKGKVIYSAHFIFYFLRMILK